MIKFRIVRGQANRHMFPEFGKRWSGVPLIHYQSEFEIIMSPTGDVYKMCMHPKRSCMMANNCMEVENNCR